MPVKPHDLLRRSALGRAALLLSLLLAQSCSHTPGPVIKDYTVPGSKTTFVTEPVFNSRIRIFQAGSSVNPPVVLIHGLGKMGMNDWKNTIPVLAQNYHLLALDLPGFGASATKNALYNIENYSQVVNWLMDTHDQKPYHVIGHSLGGAIALHLAAKHPERVASLIISDVAGILYRTTVSEYILKLNPESQDPIARIFRPIIKGFNLLLRGTAGGFGAARIQNRLHRILNDPDLRRRYLPGGSHVIAALGLVLTDFSSDLDQIHKPTQIIWSDNDNIAPLRTARLLEYKIKGSVLKIIPNGGHTPMLSQPELFNHLVLTSLHSPPVRRDPLIPENINASTNPEPAYCLHQDEPVTISGEYGRIVIDHCPNVTLTRLTATQIIINESNVQIEHTTVSGEHWGLLATESIVEISRSKFTGDGFALLALESRIDIRQSAFQGKNYGAILADSVVDLTGIAATADTAIFAIDSEFHATGCDFSGEDSGITVAFPATLMFSVSRVRKGSETSYLHGPVIMLPDKPL